jgi:hypothetical protein
MDRIVMVIVVGGAVAHEERKKKERDATTFADFPRVILILRQY